MVYQTTLHNCSTCNMPYTSYEAAEQCESRHIVEKASAAFKSDLDNIMDESKERKTNEKG